MLILEFLLVVVDRILLHWRRARPVGLHLLRVGPVARLEIHRLILLLLIGPRWLQRIFRRVWIISQLLYRGVRRRCQPKPIHQSALTLELRQRPLSERIFYALLSSSGKSLLQPLFFVEKISADSRGQLVELPLLIFVVLTLLLLTILLLNVLNFLIAICIEA